MIGTRHIYTLVIGLVFALVGCGGGGGSSSDASRPDPSPSTPSTPDPVFEITLEASAEVVDFDGSVTLSWRGELGPESGFRIYRAADHIPLGEAVVEATTSSGSVDIEGVRWDTVFRVLREGTTDFDEGGGDSVTVTVNRESYPTEQGILDVIDDRLWVWLSDFRRDGSEHLDEEGEVDWHAMFKNYDREVLDMGRYFMIEEVDWLAHWDVHSFQREEKSGFFAGAPSFRHFQDPGRTQIPQTMMFINPRIRPSGGVPTLLHEIQHAFTYWNVNEWDPGGRGGHWGYSDVGGVLGGFESGTITPVGGGVYTAKGYSPNGGAAGERRYAPLELYFMGFIGASEVPVVKYPVNIEPVKSEDRTAESKANGQVEFTADSIETRKVIEFEQYLRPRYPHIYNDDPSTARRHYRQLSVWTMDAENIPTYADLGYLADLLADFMEQTDDGVENDDYFNNWYEATQNHATIETGRLSEIMLDPPLPPVTEAEFQMMEARDVGVVRHGVHHKGCVH